MVNKIAAGEIIIAPVNALKEMMENSIDAGSTNIDILIKDGGLKILQITDNGSGIDKKDLPILCERFTTSKLSAYEDLNSLKTYGFRGEALASISHIARVTVTTKTKDDPCAWKVSYADGKMIGEPKPTAGKDGTAILVEDLFFNVQSRLRALRSPSDEYAKVLDCVGRYAIHSKNVGFSCKKFGDSQYSLNVGVDSTTQERIRTVFGGNVASNILEFNTHKLEEYGLEAAIGQVSNLNFNNKKHIPPIFFINNRLVTCDPLRRSLNQIYSLYLPKGNKSFIYLGLMIRPDLVDVNVHPTKREVRFLHETEITEYISTKLQDTLSDIDTSRSFQTTSIFSQKPLSVANDLGKAHAKLLNNPPVTSISNKIKRQENKLVRIDASQAKLSNYLKPTDYSFEATQEESSQERSLTQPEKSEQRKKATSVALSSSSFQGDDANGNFHYTTSYTSIPKERTTVNLISIKKLRKEVDDNTHRELTNTFANLTYIGVVDEQRRLASFQYDLKLLLVDYGSLCNELFYQIGLTDFANFGKIELMTKTKVSEQRGLSIFETLSSIPETSEEKNREIVSVLWSMREMLDEYFSIEIEGDENALSEMKLVALPLLLKDYMPPLAKLPFFLYRLGTKINWTEEIECLNGILQQIALFYIPEIIEQVDLNDEAVDQNAKIEYLKKSEKMANVLEHVIFPVIKKRLLASKKISGDVIEVANLPGLYKVFERC